MGRKTLAESQRITQRQVKQRDGRSLRELKVSSVNQTPTSSIIKDEAAPKKKKAKAVEKVVAADKENTPRPNTRSRRKKLPSSKSILDSSKSKKKLSIEDDFSQIVSTKLKTSSVKSETGSTSSQKELYNTSKAELQDVFASNNHNKELVLSPADSGFESSSRLSGESIAHSTFIYHSPALTSTTETLLTSESSLNYWKDLAEQRRIALEKALLENELMHDQLLVLEAENSQLKPIVQEAEAFALIVKDVVE